MAQDKVYVTDLPKTTLQWLSKDDIVQRLFKACICSFSVDTILWPDDENGTNLDSWLLAVDKLSGPRETLKCFRYLDHLFDFPDVNLSEWYEGKSEEELLINAASLLAVANIKISDVDKDIHMLEIGKFQHIVKKWFLTLSSILQTPTALLNERAYEECFRIFAEIWDLNCQSGDFFNTWEFGYNYNKEGTPHYNISSKPDLILNNTNMKCGQCGVAVVEVKKSVNNDMELDHNASEDISVSGGKRIKLEGETEDLLAAPLLEKRYINGHPRRLTEAQKGRYELFLPQLLGDAAAATCNKTMKFLRTWNPKRNHRSVIGLAVLGFEVHFVNFITVTREDLRLKNSWSMHEIPVTSGTGLDILISEPLSLLKRQDRNKLLKGFLALNTMSFLKWNQA